MIALCIVYRSKIIDQRQRRKNKEVLYICENRNCVNVMSTNVKSKRNICENRNDVNVMSTVYRSKATKKEQRGVVYNVNTETMLML